MKRLVVLAAAAFVAGAAAIPAKAEIVVGFITGLSGPLSSIGVPNSKGIAAGFAHMPTAGGETIRIVQLDDGSDPATTARNVRKLVEQDHVDFLIGSSGAPQTQAMAAIAIELKTPMVAVSPIATPAPVDGGPWVVQTPQPMSLLIKGSVDDMQARGVKKVAFIGFSDALGDLMLSALTQNAKAAGIDIVATERYARTDSSVVAQILKVVAAQPDAVFVGGTATPGALPVLALAERGYKGPLYGNNGTISTDFLRVAGKSAEGIICPTGPVTAAEQLPDANPVKPVALAFRAAYEKANGAAPTDGFSPYAFDGWVIFHDAATRALAGGSRPGTPEFKEALRRALFETKELIGAYGVYNFTPADSHGVDERSRILVRLQGGQWKLMK